MMPIVESGLAHVDYGANGVTSHLGRWVSASLVSVEEHLLERPTSPARHVSTDTDGLVGVDSSGQEQESHRGEATE